MNELMVSSDAGAVATVQRTPVEEDFAFIMRFVPYQERERIQGRLKIVALMVTRPSDEAYVREARLIAEKYGLKKWSKKSAYRWLAAYDEQHPYTSMLDDRVRRRVTAEGLAQKKDFVAWFQELCLRNKRVTSAAIAEVHNRLCSGEYIPGVGTWQMLWAAEHGGNAPETNMACPYLNGVRMPKGFSDRNLQRLVPGKFILDSMRKGNQASAMENLPYVLRTRIGLRCGQVWQIDDMWFEQKVAYTYNKYAQRVVEFSLIDVLTGKVVARIMKPVIESADGVKTLKAKWARYLIAHALCEIGIPDCGCVFQGEHGTATLDQGTIDMLHELTGGRVRFTAGGLIDKPLVAGLDRCRPKGNPRFKALIEGFHRVVKDMLGGAQGQMGGGRGKQPEWVYGMEQRDEQLRRWCRAAEVARPGITQRMRFPYPFYDDFAYIVQSAYDMIEGSVKHSLSDWKECGFVKMFWRANEKSIDWEPESKLEAFPAEIRAKLDVVLSSKPGLVKFVNMSRKEAWDSRAADRNWKLDPEIAIKVMGPQLSRTCLCKDDLQLEYKDPETMSKEIITGYCDGGILLERGKSYLVWLNPCSMKAYIADMQGKFIGVSRAVQKASYADDEAVKQQLGVRNAVIAAEVEKALPALRRIQAQANADAAHNAEVMTGKDPAFEIASDDAAGKELTNAGVADLDFTPEEKPADISFEDILD